MIKNYITKDYFQNEYKSYLMTKNDIFEAGICSFSFDYVSQMASEAINNHIILDLPTLDNLQSESMVSAIKYATAMLIEHYVTNGTNFKNTNITEGLNGDSKTITFIGDFNPSQIPEAILNHLANVGLYSPLYEDGELTAEDIGVDYLVEDKDILITSDPNTYPILGNLDYQKDFNELVEHEFENGDINAQFNTTVNGKTLKTKDGQIKFHSQTQPTTLYSLVEESKLLNLFKEYPGDPTQMVKDSIYFDYGTITGAGFFGDGSSTNSQRTKAEDIISEFASYGNGVTDLYAISTDGTKKGTVAIDANDFTINFDGLVEKDGSLRFNKQQWHVSDAAYEQVYIDTDGTTVKNANGINKHNIENVEVAETARVSDVIIDTSVTLDGVKITKWSDIVPGAPDLTPYLKTADLEAEGSQYFANKLIYGWDGSGKIGTMSSVESVTSTERFEIKHIDSALPALLIETDADGTNPRANFFNTKASVETDKDNGLSPVNVDYYNQNKSQAHKYNNIYTVNNLTAQVTENDGAAKIDNKYWTFDDEVTNQFETIGNETNKVQVPNESLYFPKNNSGVEDIHVQVAFPHQALIDKGLITEGYNIKNLKMSITDLGVTNPDMVVSEVIERDTANGNKEYVSVRYEYKYGAELVDNGSEYALQLDNRVLYEKFTQASSTDAKIKVEEGELYINDGKVYVVKTTVR